MYEQYLDPLQDLQAHQESALVLERRLGSIVELMEETESRLMRKRVELASSPPETESKLLAQIASSEALAAQAERDAQKFSNQRHASELGSELAQEFARAEYSSEAKRGLYLSSVRDLERALKDSIQKKARLEVEIHSLEAVLDNSRQDYEELLGELETVGNRATEAHKRIRELFSGLESIRVSGEQVIESLGLEAFRPQIASWLQYEIPTLGKEASETIWSVRRIKELMIRKHAPMQQLLFDLGVDYEELIDLISSKIGPHCTRDVARHLIGVLPEDAIKVASRSLQTRSA